MIIIWKANGWYYGANILHNLFLYRVCALPTRNIAPNSVTQFHLKCSPFFSAYFVSIRFQPIALLQNCPVCGYEKYSYYLNCSLFIWKWILCTAGGKSSNTMDSSDVPVRKKYFESIPQRLHNYFDCDYVAYTPKLFFMYFYGGVIYNKMHLKLHCAKWRPFWSDHNVLTHWPLVIP